MRTKPIKYSEAIVIYITEFPQGGTQWHIRPPSSIRDQYEDRLTPTNEAISVDKPGELLDLIIEMSKKKLN